MEQLCAQYHNYDKDNDLLFGHVFIYYIGNLKKIHVTAKYFNLEYHTVAAIVKDACKLKKNFKRDYLKLEIYLKSPVVCESSNDVCNDSLCESIELINSTGDNVTAVITSEPVDTTTQVDMGCINCERRSTSHSNQILALTNELRKCKIDLRRNRLEMKALKGYYSVSRVNQRAKRAKEQLQKFKNKIKFYENVQINSEKKRKGEQREDLSIHANCKRQKRDIRNYHVKKMEHAIINNTEKVQELEMTIKTQNDYITEIENNLEASKTVYEAEEGDHLFTKGQYGTTIRQTAYAMLVRHVPTAQVGPVISDVMEICAGTKLKRVPSRQTVENMARELNTLADLQAGEAIKDAEDIVMQFDATTKNGKHFNEVHLKPDKYSSFCVSIRHLSDGQADTYKQHILDSLHDICYEYSSFKDKDHDEMLANLYSRITCTLTDRAKVNDCTVKKLEMEMGTLIRLHCNVHPLDSMALKSRQYLKSCHSEEGTKCFGSDGAAANLVYAITKMRYRDTGTYT